MARQPADKSQDSKIDDSALIRELALLLDETSLTEIEIERAGLRVRVARNISVAAAIVTAAACQSTSAARAMTVPLAITSPMVTGTSPLRTVSCHRASRNRSHRLYEAK